MNLKFIAFSIFMVFSITGISQNITIKGQVLGENNEPVSFVNIGIKDKNIGTLSDEFGKFTFLVNENNLNDDLSFSHLNFKELTLNIEKIINNNIQEFSLAPTELIELEQITINFKKTQLKEIGTKSFVSYVQGIVENNDENKNIREFAKEINLKKPSKLLNLNIALDHIKIDSAVFRINIYSIKNNLPYENITSENILIKQKIVKGWNKFDLTDYDLKYNNSIFITLEYLPEVFSTEPPFIYNGRLLGKAIVRNSSLGKWEIVNGATIAMFVTVRQ